MYADIKYTEYIDEHKNTYTHARTHKYVFTYVDTDVYIIRTDNAAKPQTCSFMAAKAPTNPGANTLSAVAVGSTKMPIVM
jgi:hypothetical protein